MISLELLFEETRRDLKDHEANNTQDLSKGLRRLNLTLTDIPVLHPPVEGSKDHLQDLDAVKNCILNPAFAPKFLEISDKKAEKIFKMYADQAGLKIKEKKIKKLCKDFDKVVSYLKDFYKRPRPKASFEVFMDDFDWQEIRNNVSMSYPSGHTAMAYFIANVIADDNPSLQQDLETIAAMIGQSRIDNGVHYPSDVEFGRFIGELAAESLKSGKRKMEKKLNNRAVCDFFKNKTDQHENYTSDLASFLHRSNGIERYDLNYDDCLESSDLFLRGYPVDYCTENKFIRSHLSSLRESVSIGKINSIEKILMIHKSLGDDVIENSNGAGALRNFMHHSKSGVRYPDPTKLIEYLNSFLSFAGTPWQTHILYEWIHPFCDGNGRSGRIILANNLDYDFKAVMDLIGPDYIPRIVKGTNQISQQLKFN